MSTRPLCTALVTLAIAGSCSGQEPSTMTPDAAPTPVPPQERTAHAARVQQAEVSVKRLAEDLAARTQRLAGNQQFEWRTCLQTSCYPSQDQCMRDATVKMASGGPASLQADFDLRVTCTAQYHGCAQGCLQRVGPPRADAPEPEPEPSTPDTGAPIQQPGDASDPTAASPTPTRPQPAPEAAPGTASPNR